MRDLGGRGWTTPLLAVYAAPNDVGIVRYGLTVSGRVGTAVVRNRVRRRLREALRVRLGGLRAGIDLVIVARPAAAQATWSQLCATLEDTLVRAGLLEIATEPASSCV